MLDTTQLQKGDRCLYQGKVLIFQATVKAGNTPYHIFLLWGQEKKLSEPVAKKEVWLEITN